MSKSLFFSVLTFVFVVVVACNSNDPAVIYSDWIKQNTAYFNNMKDSAGFVNYVIPNSGGLSYYYKILKPGNPDSISPIPASVVKVNYCGKLINGKTFDSTYSGNSPLNNSTASPLVFSLQGTIVGWELNLIQMKPGEIRTVVLPMELCYGPYPMGSILPYSTLRFDIQLISFENSSGLILGQLHKKN